MFKSAFLSSNVDKVIRAVSNLFIYEKILQAQKERSVFMRLKHI